jgi:hypothetical protein
VIATTRALAIAFTALFALGSVVACVDEAETMYGVCEGSAKRGEVKAAASACDEAVKRSPTSKFGRLAADKRKEIQPALDKIAAAEKADAEKVVAAKKAADEAAVKALAAKRAAQDAEDAKCPKWVTICTTGRWPDGSERTTGSQYFDTKADCEQAGAIMGGVPCDPCACRR